MADVIELFPLAEEINAENELRWQIRRALATALGTYTHKPSPVETLEALRHMNNAMDLIQAHWQLMQPVRK